MSLTALLDRIEANLHEPKVILAACAELREKLSGLVAVAEEAERFERIFDSISQDENDGTYRLHTDAELFRAAATLRDLLSARTGEGE